MPPAVQEQTSRQRKSTNHATSVPVGQRENSKLDSLRSKEQKRSIFDVEDAPPSSLPTVVINIARGRKRDASTSQMDCVASTSASVAEQRPRKRPKRAASTPPAPRPSQVSTQLQLRRPSRSWVGSPSTDVEYVPPSRVSARLSRKIHPFFASLNSDIYRHLAGPDDTGKLLSESSVGSVISSTPNETVESQSVKRPRGRRRRNTDLTDENAKRVLMEEWARMRQSQGSLPLPGITGNACSGQIPLHESTRSVSSMQLKATIRRSSPDMELSETQAKTIIDISQSQRTILNASVRGTTLTRIDSGNACASGKKLDHKDSVLSSDARTEHPIIPNSDIAAPSTLNFDPHLDEGFPNDKPCVSGAPHDSLQCHGSSAQPLCASPPREGSILIRHENSTRLPQQAIDLDSPPKDGRSVTFLETFPYDAGSIHLDTDEQFYMLDVPDVFTLPWVSVSSHLYVPPGLAKLISGMREQLTMEARARRRAEELYQAELCRRISAEKTIQDLRTRLEEQQGDSSNDRQDEW